MNSNYPKEQVEFLQAVLEMREAQRDYFNQKDDYRLKLSIRKEQKVDSLLQPYINAGVIKPKPKAVDNTPTLFG
jgi:hypothetical protein